MSLLHIVLYPDPGLKKMCLPVKEVTPEIQQLVDDMAETMYDAPGVGLAAPQIGRNLRITVMDCSEKEEEPDLLVLINPEIIEKEGKLVWEEGCLSIPNVYGDVTRAQKIRVRALDRNGQSYEFEAEDLLSVCVQHELDHLDGILFLDHLSRLKRRLAERSFKRQLPDYLEEQEEKIRKRIESEQEAEAIRNAPSVLSIAAKDQDPT